MAEQKNNIWQELRKPFPKEVMGLLPKVSCYACAQATKQAKSALDKHCAKHKMIRCEGESLPESLKPGCGSYITEAHIHLDFVGHAAVTDRLNTVVGPDDWVLEPMGTDDQGNPVIKNGELWCWLTIHGTRKMCVGDGATSGKELTGDALRNGAMRFGIALDLWTKDELESTLEDPSLENDKLTRAAGPAAPATPRSEEATKIQKGQITALLRGHHIADSNMIAVVKVSYGYDLTKLSKQDANDLIKKIKANPPVAES